ncbi:MAG: 50S ribosomal protein L29 [Nitrospinota bacterium]
MKASEVRELTNEEAVMKLDDLRKEYLNLRFQHATQQLENKSKIRQVRRDIARIHTVVWEKKKEEGAKRD